MFCVILLKNLFYETAGIIVILQLQPWNLQKPENACPQVSSLYSLV